MEWLTAFTQWITDLIRGLWQDFINFLSDFWVDIISQILTAISGLVSSIPVPGFLNEYSIGSILGSLPSEMLYFTGLMHLSEGFALLSLAFSFRMFRKVITLFRW